MLRLSGSLLAAAALAYPALAASSVRSYAPAAKQASSPNVVSSHVLSLKKSGSNKEAKSAGHLRSLRTLGGLIPSNSSSSAEPVDNLESDEYVAEIEWAGVPVEVIIDSGSSDTWLVQAGFQCVDSDGNEQAVSFGSKSFCSRALHILLIN